MRKRLLYTASLALLLCASAAACGACDRWKFERIEQRGDYRFKPLDAGGPLTKAAAHEG